MYIYTNNCAGALGCLGPCSARNTAISRTGATSASSNTAIDHTGAFGRSRLLLELTVRLQHCSKSLLKPGR